MAPSERKQRRYNCYQFQYPSNNPEVLLIFLCIRIGDHSIPHIFGKDLTDDSIKEIFGKQISLIDLHILIMIFHIGDVAINAIQDASTEVQLWLYLLHFVRKNAHEIPKYSSDSLTMLQLYVYILIIQFPISKINIVTGSPQPQSLVPESILVSRVTLHSSLNQSLYIYCLQLLRQSRMQFYKADIGFNFRCSPSPSGLSFIDQMIDMNSIRQQLLCLRLRLDNHIQNIFAISQISQIVQCFQQLLICKDYLHFNPLQPFVIQFNLICFTLHQQLQLLLIQNVLIWNDL